MKNSAKFELQKYNGPATRHTCPNCRQPRQFTRYVEIETGRHVAEGVGICNRSSKCGYHRTPRQFFADNPPLSGAASAERHPPRALPAPPDAAPPIHVLPPKHFQKSLGNHDRNNFVRFLLTRFDSQTVEQAVDRFGIGTDGSRSIFWQIDRQGRIHTGKIILFDPQTGRRSKTVPPNWIHAELRRKKMLPTNFALSQCFFGEHQLPDEPAKPVGIAESEKTSVIASIYLPDFVWLSCGGKTQITPDRLESLERPATLFPDADGFEKWSLIAVKARHRGLDVQVSDLIERRTTPQEKAEGFDLADYLLERDQATPQGADFLPALLDVLENLTADEHEAAVNELETRIELLTASGMGRQQALELARRDLYPLWQARFKAEGATGGRDA